MFLQAPYTGTALAVGDFDGDGWPDVAVACREHVIEYFRGSGVGQLSLPVSIPTGTLEPSGIVAADFNGDGAPEIVVADRTQGRIGVIEHSSVTGWRAMREFASPGPFPGIAAGDFTGDGKLDLLVGSSSVPTVVGVLRNEAGRGPLDVPPGPAISSRLMLYAAPNPFASRTQLRFRGLSAAGITVDILDVSGRRLRRLESPQWTTGETTIDWDGRDDAGRPVGPGLYFARAVAGSTSVVARVVRVR